MNEATQCASCLDRFDDTRQFGLCPGCCFSTIHFTCGFHRDGAVWSNDNAIQDERAYCGSCLLAARLAGQLPMNPDAYAMPDVQQYPPRNTLTAAGGSVGAADQALAGWWACRTRIVLPALNQVESWGWVVSGHAHENTMNITLLGHWLMN